MTNSLHIFTTKLSRDALKGVPVTVINDRYYMGYLSPKEFREIILLELGEK
jgi:hypothetical protein